MNEKKCKALRRVARLSTIGAPEKSYFWSPRGALCLHKASTRGFYKQLKKEAQA